MDALTGTTAQPGSIFAPVVTCGTAARKALHHPKGIFNTVIKESSVKPFTGHKLHTVNLYSLLGGFIIVESFTEPRKAVFIFVMSS